MKKIITISLLALTITSCSVNENVENPQELGLIKVESLMGTVDQGLHKIQLNDTTTILLYRGTESCTMIQLK
jgi:hypothetical protein